MVFEFMDVFSRLWTIVTSYVEKNLIWEKKMMWCILPHCETNPQNDFSKDHTISSTFIKLEHHIVHVIHK